MSKNSNNALIEDPKDIARMTLKAFFNIMKL